MTREPTLEEFKLDISVYKKYREEAAIFRERLSVLEKEKKSIESSVVFVLSIAICFLSIWFLFASTPFLFGADDWSSIWVIFSFWASASFTGAISNFIANLISFGRIKELKRLSGEIEIQAEKLKEETSQKLQPFEQAAREYYLSELREFFENNLYKKRSGNQQFEEALSEFSSMIEDLSKMDSLFVTTSVSWDLREYREYVKKRIITHNLQSSKTSARVASVHNFVRKISEPTEPKKEIIAPERLYRTARKIDWEALNKQRKLTGTRGEEIAVAVEQEYFESIGRKDLATRVRHVSSEDGDGLGYDVLSFFVDGREKYIEVKSTTASLTTPLYLSRNELSFLREHPDDAFIYRILVSGENSHIESQASSHFLLANNFIPVRYIAQSI
ncbi:MAG: DUF3883 domain-containing protein [Candidatus Paceibacteria bacterium]